MTATRTPRRMLLSLLVAAAALLSLGAGQALAAQRPAVAPRTTAVHHRVMAFADGTLTQAQHGATKRPLARANVRMMVVATRKPVAYADGLLTHTRSHRQHRRILARTA